MSRSKRGGNGLKGKHMRFKKIKRASNSKMRVRSAALCHKAAKEGDIERNMFPVRQEGFAPWWIW